LNRAPTDQLTVRTAFAVEFECWKLASRARLTFVADVYNEHGVNVFTTASKGDCTAPAGLLRASFIVPADLMNDGTYRICLLVLLNGHAGAEDIDWNDLLAFEIHDVASEFRGDYHGHWSGALRPNLEWRTELLESLPASGAGAQVLL
jgi:lipopolysaccharide transport system ATP-binding protein